MTLLPGRLSRRQPGSPDRRNAAIAFIGLGPVTEAFLRSAAAAGTLRLEYELAAIAELVAVWSREAVVSALERAARFSRFKAGDVRAILEAGPGLPKPVRAGQQLVLDLPMDTTPGARAGRRAASAQAGHYARASGRGAPVG